MVLGLSVLFEKSSKFSIRGAKRLNKRFVFSVLSLTYLNDFADIPYLFIFS